MLTVGGIVGLMYTVALPLIVLEHPVEGAVAAAV
jgi:hypothetical protein